MESYLPELQGLAHGLRQGRNVYEGYQRGWGLQFGGLRDAVVADPLYQEAIALAAGRTIMAELNRMNIFLIMRFFLRSIERGAILEFGSYLGGNAIFMAHVARRLHPGMKVYALDTFEGMPATDKNVDAHNEGDFSGVDLDELRSFAASSGLDNLEFVKGYFEDTTPGVLQKAGRVALAHIDCDILPSVQYSYEAVKSHMVDGGYLVFDDATVSSCIGATEAVEDLLIRRDALNSEQIYPHFVFRSFTGRR
jgi:macrocin-O-methyltransferase TylF-like protien